MIIQYLTDMNDNEIAAEIENLLKEQKKECTQVVIIFFYFIFDVDRNYNHIVVFSEIQF